MLRPDESVDAFPLFSPVNLTIRYSMVNKKFLIFLRLLADHLLLRVPSRLGNSMQTEDNMPEHTNPPGSDLDANFVGWQQTLSGKPFPLFNITKADHPSYLSTVSDATLLRLGLRVPRTLSPYHEKV